VYESVKNALDREFEKFGKIRMEMRMMRCKLRMMVIIRVMMMMMMIMIDDDNDDIIIIIINIIIDKSCH